MTATAAPSTTRRPATRLLRYLAAAWVPDAFAVWFVLLGLAGVLVIAQAASGEVEESIWEMTAVIPRWALMAVGGYFALFALPLQLSHGSTRREFATRNGLFCVAFCGLGAVLMAAGFLVEALLYRVNGWPQELYRAHLFTEPGRFAAVVGEYWLVLAAWTLAGTVLGAAYYRGGTAAAATASLPAVLVLVPVEFAVGSYLPPILAMFTGVTLTPDPLTAALTCTAGFLAATATAWGLLRDVPLGPPAG